MNYEVKTTKKLLSNHVTVNNELKPIIHELFGSTIIVETISNLKKGQKIIKKAILGLSDKPGIYFMYNNNKVILLSPRARDNIQILIYYLI